MKVFICSLAVLLSMIAAVTVSDIYCNSVCKRIEEGISASTEEGAKAATELFLKNEFILKASVDMGYINEAKVSLKSLEIAYSENEPYEARRYTEDALIRVQRIRYALFI